MEGVISVFSSVVGFLAAPVAIPFYAVSIIALASELKGLGKGGALIQPLIDMGVKWATPRLSPKAREVLSVALQIESDITGKQFVMPDAAPAVPAAPAPTQG